MRETLSDLLRRSVKDPRLGDVAITGVEVSEDLRHARVYYSIYGSGAGSGSAGAAAQKGLEKASGYIRRLMGRELKLRRMPEITFHRDDSLEYGERIDGILRRLQGHDDDGRSSEREEP